MSVRRAIVLSATLVMLSGGAPAEAAEPAPRWRAATEADIRAMQAATPAAAETGTAANSQPATDASDAAPSVASGQRAFIDPATDELVPAPVVAPQPETGGTPTAAPDFRLQRSPEGYLYIDTSGYQHFETATLKADGSVAIECNIPGHSHPHDATPAEPVPDASDRDASEPDAPGTGAPEPQR